MGDYIGDLLPGLATTFWLWLWILAIGLPVGVVFGFVLAYGPPALRWSAAFVVNVARGFPGLVLLYLVYSGLPDVGILLSGFASVVAAFAFATAGYTADIFRAAILNVSTAQREAATALALTFWRTQRLVVLPQALRSVTPAIIAFSVIVLQATSLAFAVGLRETTGLAYSLGTLAFDAVRYMVAAGLIYLVLCVAGSQLAALVQRRLSARSHPSSGKSSPRKPTKEYIAS